MNQQHLRINRNIMECKGDCCYIACRNGKVLIETLWNVKGHKWIRVERGGIVLIETLWNVKEGS